MTSKTAALIRLSYPYGKQQIFLPMDLNKVAARFENVGIETQIVDLNLEDMPENIDGFDYVGMGIIGAPYMPIARDVAAELKGKTKNKLFIGGPGVEYLKAEEFERIFGDNAMQIKRDSDLSAVMPLEQKVLPSVFDTSVAERIKSMDPSKAKKYLKNEFSFFVSQGCKYACDFCAAVRTRPGHNVSEQYSRVIREDLEALTDRANEFGIKRLTMYLTPLDLFQNPAQFKEALRTIAEVKKASGVDFTLRGLSRVDSFLEALREESELYDLIPAAGLQTVGFGVDGTTEEVWKSQHKGNKSLSNVDDAFAICKTLGITPEALMVMGFHDKNGKPVDTQDSLLRNVEYSITRADQYGVVARPHVAKDLVPGNSGWENPVWAEQRSQLLYDPKLFKNLDFVALASKLTHPNPQFRSAVNDAYLQIVDSLSSRGLCATNPLIPYTGDAEKDKIADEINQATPFDK